MPLGECIGVYRKLRALVLLFVMTYQFFQVESTRAEIAWLPVFSGGHVDRTVEELVLPGSEQELHHS
jgi:hypothetical protein